MKSNIAFTGREAIAAQLASGVKKRLATFTVEDPQVILLGRETIYRDGRRAGWLSSGGFGHSIGKPIGLGYVRDPEGVTEDYLRQGPTSLRSPPSGFPPRCTWPRSGIPRTAASGLRPGTVALVLAARRAYLGAK